MWTDAIHMRVEPFCWGGGEMKAALLVASASFCGINISAESSSKVSTLKNNNNNELVRSVMWKK